MAAVEQTLKLSDGHCFLKYGDVAVHYEPVEIAKLSDEKGSVYGPPSMAKEIQHQLFAAWGKRVREKMLAASSSVATFVMGEDFAEADLDWICTCLCPWLHDQEFDAKLIKTSGDSSEGLSLKVSLKLK